MRKPLSTRVPGSAVLRRFLAMELDPIQAQPGRQVPHHCGFFIDEDPDAQDEGRQLPDNLPGCLRRDPPGAFGMKDKPQGVRPQLRRQQGVFQIGNTADFDAHHVL